MGAFRAHVSYNFQRPLWEALAATLWAPTGATPFLTARLLPTRGSRHVD
jgi:hypothetical protein